MDAFLSVGMKQWDPNALLAHRIGPLCTIAVDHFARLAIGCDRRDGATSMLGGWNGEAAYRCFARSTCRFEERCSMARLGPAARSHPPASWPHGLASLVRA